MSRGCAFTPAVTDYKTEQLEHLVNTTDLTILGFEAIVLNLGYTIQDDVNYTIKEIDLVEPFARLWTSMAASSSLPSSGIPLSDFRRDVPPA